MPAIAKRIKRIGIFFPARTKAHGEIHSRESIVRIKQSDMRETRQLADYRNLNERNNIAI
ncbi:hypothetical protein EGT33_12185 [Burkholderia multivorans]|jgi:hypothetical protein|nr:hypothetical protein C6T71_21155 [Burkholderia multivorans]RSB77965.1 hypothetical protein EGT33_12185 [Burkholderia multivorans]